MKKSMLLVFIVVTVLLSGCAPISTPESTSTPFIMPAGDFKMSWDIYSSQYNPSGGILTIRRQGATYTQTVVFSDGSCGTTDLDAVSEGGEIKLSESSSVLLGKYMINSSNGYLSFYDSQGSIYGVSPLGKASDVECVQPKAVQSKQINVTMSVVSVDPVGGNEVKITVITNLPEGTTLMFDLKNSGGYSAQGGVIVSEGQLTTTFGNVMAGNYHLTVTSPYANIQPENVQAILGANGENMTGDLVTFDQSSNNYFLEYTSNIEVK